MRYLLDLNRQPVILKVTVKTRKPQQVMLSVYDARKKNTFFSKQLAEVNGNDTFEISLPVTPEKAFFEANVVGSLSPLGFNDGLEVQIQRLPFQTPIECKFQNDPVFSDFMKLGYWFCENAGILSASFGENEASIYKSPSGRFQIKYLPVIIDDQKFLDANATVPNPNYGLPSPTSYRVNAEDKGKMELAQKYVVDYTYPQRWALYLHEGAHDFMNTEPESEEEADYHAVLIARCMGFGQREIGQAFTKVFNRYPSPQNKRRIDLIMNQLKGLK